MICKEGFLPMKDILTALEKLLKRRSSVERFQFKLGISKIMENLDMSNPTVPEPEPKPLPEVDLDAIYRDEEYRNEINWERANMGLVKFV